MSDSRHGSSAARQETAGDAGKGDADPLIGRVISGRFRVVSVIARGGMGKVYKAEQAPLGRVCALKVLSPKYEGDRDPEFHKRFFLEAATAAKLTHANTVTIFDYGQDGDDLYYIAMEYIEGKTLHRTLRAQGPFDDVRTAHIAAQICRSLREAHGVGVVHRDLKPGNILLSDRADEHDFVKVLDFGLVKDVTGEAEDLTQAGLFMGSPKYMAPEQILGAEVTARTDIYSLGVMMYEMLCGKVPFDRGASVGTLMAHVNDPLPPMRQVNPALRASPTMENIVYRCLEKDADRRFASMKDLLAALKRIGNEDGPFTETQESLPAPRYGVAASQPPDGAVNAPSITPPSVSGPQAIPVSSRPQPTPSVSETLDVIPGVPEDAAVRGPARARQYLFGGVLIVVGLAVALAVVQLSGRKPAAPGDAASTASATASVSAAPTAATTVSPTTTAVAPAAPLIRQVRVESEPPGATVSEGDTQLCTSTPCELTWKDDAARAEHKLQVVKKGYKPIKVTVSPTEEKVRAALEVYPVAAPPPPPPPPGTGRPLYKKDF